MRVFALCQWQKKKKKIRCRSTYLISLFKKQCETRFSIYIKILLFQYIYNCIHTGVKNKASERGYQTDFTQVNCIIRLTENQILLIFNRVRLFPVFFIFVLLFRYL